MMIFFILLETTYDKIVNVLLNNWITAVIVLISVIVIAIPQLRDGVKMLFGIFNKKRDSDKIIYADETISFDVKLLSQDFDIVKINATTHILGVSAEYEWIKKHYPDYIVKSQTLSQFKLADNSVLYFDKINISKEHKYNKSIWFDIISFYEGASAPFTGKLDKYATKKIMEIYQKKLWTNNGKYVHINRP